MDIGTLQALKSEKQQEEERGKAVRMYQLCRTDFLLRMIEEIGAIEEPSYEIIEDTIKSKFNVVFLTPEQKEKLKEEYSTRRKELMEELQIPHLNIKP